MSDLTIPQNVLVLPDIHYPVEDRLTMRAVERYARDHKWSEMIQLGDLMDFNVISSHNAHDLRAVAGQTIQKDYNYANKRLDSLFDHVQHRNVDCKLVVLEGNHDERIERYINANPQLEGSVELAHNLKFDERGVNWVRFWTKGDIYKIGKAQFIHGRYTNDHHAKKHVLAYGENVFYGHLHDFQLYSLVRIGDNKTIVGQSLGCLCDYKQLYLKGRPNRWQQGFGVFRFFPNGYFTYYPVMIFNHRFVSPEGEVYDGNKS